MWINESCGESRRGGRRYGRWTCWIYDRPLTVFTHSHPLTLDFLTIKFLSSLFLCYPDASARFPDGSESGEYCGPDLASVVAEAKFGFVEEI